MIRPLRRLSFTALALAGLTASSATAQTNTFNTGSAFNSPVLTGFVTTGSLMGGMLVTWTFAGGGGTFSSNWGNLGGGLWGVSSSGFSVTMNGGSDTFGGLWTLTNATAGRVQSVQFNGAPGRTIFDCSSGTGCTPDTPGSAQGLSLTSIGGTYSGGVSGAYTNRVGIGGAAPVGDLYEQLTINFDAILGSQGTYTWNADTDNSDFNQDVPTVVTPEPGTWALMLAGLAAVGVVSRRRRRQA